MIHWFDNVYVVVRQFYERFPSEKHTAHYTSIIILSLAQCLNINSIAMFFWDVLERMRGIEFSVETKISVAVSILFVLWYVNHRRYSDGGMVENVIKSFNQKMTQRQQTVRSGVWLYVLGSLILYFALATYLGPAVSQS